MSLGEETARHPDLKVFIDVSRALVLDPFRLAATAAH
jgi:hypothetical protein